MQFARDCVGQDDENPSSNGISGARPCREFRAGDFVACVDEESTLKNPKFMIGRVQCYTESDSDLCQLLWYKNLKGSLYQLELEGPPWVEREDSLVAVKMAQSRKFGDQFTLQTAGRTIHKAVFKD
jgi:hypothetical protein